MIGSFDIENCFAIKYKTQKNGSQKKVELTDTINLCLKELGRFDSIRVINIETIYDTKTVKVWYEQTKHPINENLSGKLAALKKLWSQ